MKEQIEQILESESLLEEMMLKLIQEINEDDEPLDKRCRQLLLSYMEDSEMDNVLMSLCGWNLRSLIGMVLNDHAWLLVEYAVKSFVGAYCASYLLVRVYSFLVESIFEVSNSTDVSMSTYRYISVVLTFLYLSGSTSSEETTLQTPFIAWQVPVPCHPITPKIFHNAHGQYHGVCYRNLYSRGKITRQRI